jgi:hypothetical protein
MGIKQMIADQCLSRSDDYKKYWRACPLIVVILDVYAEGQVWVEHIPWMLLTGQPTHKNSEILL